MSGDVRVDLGRLEDRVAIVESKVFDVSRISASQEVIVARLAEKTDLFVSVLNEIRDEQKKVDDKLISHMLDDSKDRVRMFIGLVSSIMIGAASFATLLWAVIERVHMP